jgi:hypothetical protein
MSLKSYFVFMLIFTLLLSSCYLPTSTISSTAMDIPPAADSPTTEIVKLPDEPVKPGIQATLTPIKVPFTLATPFSQEPASGICGMAEGEWVRMTIYTDIPDPRCVKVKPEQKLTVVNQTKGRINVSLGLFQSYLDPGEEAHLDQPFGTYLASGVHLLEVDPCCGGAIWLIEMPLE